MTIYDAAPALLGVGIIIMGTTLCLIDHRRIVAARKSRRAATEQAIAAE